MALQQQNRLLNLNTILGDDVLLLTSFSGSEEMGRLFNYQLELISDDPSIRPEDIVGTPVGWSIELPDQSRRYWHGYVNSLSRGDIDFEDRRNYRVNVVPWLWFLTQTSDCKIFQEKKVPDIIDDVLGEYSFADFEPKFQQDHKDWEYCVQYRETDFNFLSRLMEQEGMFYFFEHSDGAHKMIITDHKTAYYNLPENTVDYPDDVGSRAIEDHFTSWERKYQFIPGKYAQTDYNFKTPSTSLASDSSSVVNLKDIGSYELYDYPGEYDEKGVGDTETRVRIEAEETRYDIVSATSFCKTFQVGGRFTVGEHRDSSEQGANYAITSIQHMASEPMAYETGGDNDLIYRNSISCISAERVYRTARQTAKPIISGIQTAVITGPPGEEIYPDEYGRVKCQFHWDRYGENDDKSSCWIRVSQGHAGAGFGAISIPRIGEEVVISFLEGDPDRPLITGRVYHAQNMPPFGLPDSKNISGVKTNSTKGGGGYNELIMDDTKSKELIRLHAQYDMDSTIEHDDRQTVHNDRSIQVDGTHTETIKKDTTITVTEGNWSRTISKGMSATTVKKEILVDSETQHIHVTAATEIKLEVGKSKLVMKADGSIELSGMNIAIDGKESVSIHGAAVTSKADNNNVMEGAMVLSKAKANNMIKGGMIMLN
ncbi:type VI secretion system Vgr family protein [Roseiconus lacunae]|uniref:Type VI secretion system tip protein VgrG n=1 Tax=Roseiconus lacunae TaxID=2605694 RepID=A0ABT7PKQ5_9BACT|nr:type VI secretion system tip protein VgrG [Roseiconus lacunae]MDM4017083.1 type VI secretion system tip protein VgrG [Roseiconus lacunae]